jgi:C-terminal processing protease CtpA/Prc
MKNMRNAMRYGIGSAAAIAMIAGAAVAQQSQQQMPHHQMGQQYGQQPTQYRDSGNWRSVDFVPELSDTIVILKSKETDQEANVHIIHGQVKAKLDGQKVSPQQVEKRGDQLRLLDNEGQTVAEFTLPDLQMIRQAHGGQMQQRQLGVQDPTFDRQPLDRQFGVQEQWRDDWRTQDRQFQQDRQVQGDDWRFRTQDRQDDWRFRDQQRTQDQRFRDQQRFQDQRFQDQGFREQQRYQDQRFQEQTFRDTPRRDPWGTQPQYGQQHRMSGMAEQQLGVSLSPAPMHELRQTRYNQGLVIEHVERNSPLVNHGLRSGDIIVSVDGRPATFNTFERTVTQIEPRDTLRLTVVRGGQERTLNLRGNEVAMGQQFGPRFGVGQDTFDRDRRVFGAPETGLGTPMIGIQMQEARQADLRRLDTRYNTGIEVQRVMTGSPADRAGLRSGDIIVEIDGRGNVTPDGLRQEINFRRQGEPLHLTVIRDNRERNINLRTDARTFEDRRIDDRRYGTFDDRGLDTWGTQRRQWEEPSEQERLFRLPGQVPPGPDRGVYQPSVDQDEWGEYREFRRDTWDTRRGTWDTGRDAWNTGRDRDTWEYRRDMRNDRWDR